MVITDCGCCGGQSGQVRQLVQVTWAQIPGYPVTSDSGHQIVSVSVRRMWHEAAPSFCDHQQQVHGGETSAYAH